MSKRSNIGIGLVLGAGLVAWWAFVIGMEFIRFHGSNSDNRGHLMVLRQDIQLGDGYEKVLKTIWPHLNGSELRFSSDDPACWVVKMPPEITTTDWRLYIGFSDEKVDGLIIRTSDGPPPRDGPQDFGLSRICGF